MAVSAAVCLAFLRPVSRAWAAGWSLVTACRLHGALLSSLDADRAHFPWGHQRQGTAVRLPVVQYMLALATLLLAAPAQAVEGGALLWRAHTPGLPRATACTATLARPPGSDETFVITARHCAPQAGEAVELVLGATARRLGEDTVINGTRRTGIANAGMTLAGRFDLLWVPLPTAAEGAGAARRFANRLPAAGSRLHVTGFPGGVGPVASLCTLVGPALRADNPLEGFRLDQEMACPARESWRGISGAPVLDERGDVVGIVLAAAASGTALYFQPLLASNLHASGEPVQPGDGTGARVYENVRLGAGARGYRLEVALQNGVLNGAARLYGATGSPHASLTFDHADLRGPVMLFDHSGAVMLDATVAAGRLTVRLFSPSPDLGDATAGRRLPASPPSRSAVNQLINQTLMGHPAN